MNLQEAKQDYFNRSYLGLKSQGFERSRSSIVGCAYRGSNGMKCAIGHLIPDEMYNSIIEGNGIISTIRKYPDHLPENFFVFAYGSEERKFFERFLSELQGVHDLSTEPNLMENNLHSFAACHSLTIPEE